MFQLTEQQLMEKWGDVINFSNEKIPSIKDYRKKRDLAVMLETTQSHRRTERDTFSRLLMETPVNAMAGSSSTAGDGNFDIYDPILISMVRRNMPNLMAYDVASVVPMTGPSGAVFALRNRYDSPTGNEMFYYEADTEFGTVTAGANTLGDKHVGTTPGTNTQTNNLASTGVYNFGDGMTTTVGEQLGNSTVAFPQVGFSIEKVLITARERAISGEYTVELAQDMRAIHNLDVETEITNMMSMEIMAEINRELIRTIYVSAVRGCTEGTVTAGIFNMDTDSNGRWAAEKFKGLIYQIDKESHKIAKETRLGRGNILICSANVASALEMAEVLDYAPALDSKELQIDDTGNTFAGVIRGRMKVYIDPYATGADYMVVGYKGADPKAAGIFYCPYVPLQLLRAVDPNQYHPKLAFKTRYAIAPHPLAKGPTAADGSATIEKDSNVFYRRSLINNL